MWRPVLCFFFSFFSFVWGRFFSVFLLIQMRKTWWHLESWNDFGKERQKERKKERERHFEKKKGRNFLSLSLSREKKHLLHTFVLYNDLVFSFFFQKTCETTLMTREKKGGKKTHRVSLFFASLDTLKRKQPLCFVIL